MSLVLTPEWEYYHIADSGNACVLCGQASALGDIFCATCVSHRNGIVLSTCRNLLFRCGRTLDLKDDESFTELAVGFVLEHFPIHLASVVQVNSKKLMTSGAWFAHVVAYRRSVLLAPADTVPQDIVSDSVFTVARFAVFNALKEIKQPPGYNYEDGTIEEEYKTLSFEILKSAFGTDENETNMRFYTLRMIEDLDKEKKLKMLRHESNVSKALVRLGITRSGGLRKRTEKSKKSRHREKMHVSPKNHGT